MTTTILSCAAILTALLFVLCIRTSMARGKAGENQFPTASDDPLFVAIRAHGNAAENIPIMVALLLFIGSRPDPALWMAIVAVVATVARFMHAIGVITEGDMAKENKLRLVGAILSSLSGLAMAVAVAVLI